MRTMCWIVLAGLRKLRCRPALLLLALLTVGAQAAHAQGPSVRFAVIGDYGSGDLHEQWVADLVKSWNPEFIVTTGDNNEPSGGAETIDANIGQFYQQFIYPYAGAYGPGSPDINRFFPCPGNHDWDSPTGLQPYLDYFTLPGKERYYDFTWGPVHCFIVDGDRREPDGITSTSIQAQWLRNRLAASTAPWKLVFEHFPPFSSRTSWVKLQWPYQEWGATAIISGNAHVYERIMRNGFPYITNGLGGDSTGKFDQAIEGSTVQFGDDYGAMQITASMESITFQFITRQHVLIDSYTINRPPLAPTSLAAAMASGSQIDLTWTDNSGLEEGFEIQRSLDGISFSPIGTVAPNINTYSDNGLSAATTYYYRVRAFGVAGTSDFSNTAAATTEAPPAGPTTLTAMEASISHINLAWVDNSGNEEEFQIERSLDGISFGLIAAVGADQTTYADSGLAGGMTYYYRVRASNSGGDSDYSNTASATTLALPIAPANLAATAVSTTQINLTWTDLATNEDGFKLYRSLDGVNFVQCAVLGANVTSYSDTGRSPATHYYYRICTYSIAGESTPSNVASATTESLLLKPNAPGKLAATAVSRSQIKLVWRDHSSNETGFKILRSTDSKTFVEVGSVGANVTTYLDSGLAADTKYRYRVYAYNAAGNSALSNTALAKTRKS